MLLVSTTFLQMYFVEVPVQLYLNMRSFIAVLVICSPAQIRHKESLLVNASEAQ